MPRKKLKKAIHSNEHFKKFKLLNFIEANNYPSVMPIPKPIIEDGPGIQFVLEHKDTMSLLKDMSNKVNNSEDYVKVEEHTLEYITHPMSGRVWRMVILWRPSDNTYHGTLLNNTTDQVSKPE